jgi:DNA-binding response OmpR family regulator
LALLVEDNHDLREVISCLLLRKFPDMRVEQADTGGAAMRLVRSTRPDVILLDLMLPDDSGLALAEGIRQIDQDTVILIVSNLDLPEYRQAAFRKGVDCYLYKGSSSLNGDIVARVEGALKRRRRQGAQSGCAPG